MIFADEAPSPDLAFYAYRDMETCDDPLCQAGRQRSPVSLAMKTPKQSLNLQLAQIPWEMTRYTMKIVLPTDEVANFPHGDGLRKAFNWNAQAKFSQENSNYRRRKTGRLQTSVNTVSLHQKGLIKFVFVVRDIERRIKPV